MLHPTVDLLKRFLPLQTLGHSQLSILANSLVINRAPANRVLMEIGSEEPYSFFLLEGTVKLTATDNKTTVVAAGETSASNPIAQLLPRRYRVVSLTQIQYLKIEHQQLEELQHTTSRDEPTLPGYTVSGEDADSPDALEDNISYAFLQDLENDKVKLPSLPDVAARITTALKDKVSDAEQIALIIQHDPVITAKLIKAANSAMYGSRAPVESCAAAVVRLGTEATHNLVVSYSMKELFQSRSSVLRMRMQELWDHSTQVAAVCYVLASHDSHFLAEQAMLIGLLHDIGAVAILQYAENFPEQVKDSGMLEQTVNNLKARTGSLILRRWGFPNEFLVAALEAEKWMRNEDPAAPADYCDLVIIAQLHCYIGTRRAAKLPAINEVPAHTRLELGNLTPHLSLQILEEAKEQLAHAEGVLNF